MLRHEIIEKLKAAGKSRKWIRACLLLVDKYEGARDLIALWDKETDATEKLALLDALEDHLLDEAIWSLHSDEYVDELE